jgi:hypothetical protein
MSAIYRDPATGWLYRVSPQPEHGSYVMQYRDPANSATWKWCANWNIGNIYRESLEEVLEARAKRDGWELVSGPASSEPPEVVDEGEEYSPCDTCRCPDCIESSCPQAGCDKTDGGFGCFAPYEECPAPAEETCPDERLEKEVGKCKNQSVPNGDAAATTAGSAVPEPAETSTTPTDANTLPAPGCPADAGSATQSLSAAGPASLEAEPEATPFDYSGLDAQTVADLHLAEREYLGGRKLAEMGLRRMADGVAIAHETLCGSCDKLSQLKHGNRGEESFGAWCESVGLHRKAAERLLQVAKLMDGSSPREQKVLEELSPSLLYATAKPSAPAELVQAVKDGDITTHKQYQDALAEIRKRDAKIQELLEMSEASDRRADEAQAWAKKVQHEAELDRKEREDAHAAALRYKAEADRRAQDQNRLEGLVQTVTHERDGARQALAAAKLRGDKLKEENDALREQPIRGDFADADEIDRRAQEKAEAMTAEYRDQIAELQDRAETGDANACYDQVILASRALENAWTLAKSAYKRLPAGMRAYPREMLHNAFAKFEEELKCL